MSTQFLTAVFELLPTRRKAAILEDVRSRAEAAFWEAMETLRPEAEAIAKITEGALVELPAKAGREAKTVRASAKSVRSNAIKGMQKRIYQIAVKQGCGSQVATSLRTDVTAALASFVELSNSGKQDAGFPHKASKLSLNDFRCAVHTVEPIYLGKINTAFSRSPLAAKPRPFALDSNASFQLIRTQSGQLSASLSILPAKSDKSHQPAMRAGENATTGEKLEAGAGSKTALVIPVACSKWHENKFLNGKATSKSAKIIREGERWFIAIAFAFEVEDVVLSGAIVGIDRGIVNPIAMTVVGNDGGVVTIPSLTGSNIRDIIIKTEEKRKKQQRRGKKNLQKHVNHVNDILHNIANDVVNAAKKHRAAVVIEDLQGLKSMITASRPAGSTKGGMRHALKKAQLAKLENLLNYKLAMAGLPAVKSVFAAGTSLTCASCGHVAKENRLTQNAFKCASCGHEANADENASVVIARRGIFLRTLKKGDKLDVLHLNMVEALRKKSQDDNGPGLSDHKIGEVVVARDSGLVGSYLQRAVDHHVVESQNPSDRILAEPGHTHDIPPYFLGTEGDK